MIYCGIDPGKAGAIAFIDDNTKETRVHDLPFIEKDLDVVELGKIIMHYGPDIVCLEKCQAIPNTHKKGVPKMGSVSAFSFGKSIGRLEALLILLKVSYQEIRPQIWKKEFELLNKKKTDSVIMANKLFPTAEILKSKDGRAEALLMAEYAKRKLDKKQKV